MSAIAFTDAPTCVESCLFQLARYGAPFIMQGSDGTWSCVVNMRVNATGVTFEVKAREGKTPLEAAQNCYRNMQKAIETVNRIGEAL